jgi:hypothetical protein
MSEIWKSMISSGPLDVVQQRSVPASSDMASSASPNRWDARPLIRLYGGLLFEFYRRGDLAKALNRAVVTIRSLEQRGILRKPTLRSERGHWLYTRSQIEQLIVLAAEEDVLDPSMHRAFSERFTQKAHRILSRFPDPSEGRLPIIAPARIVRDRRSP